MKKKVNISNKLLGSALALGLVSTLSASAIVSPQINTDSSLSINELPANSLLLSEGTGDHKCGEGKCGGSKKEEPKDGDHKCGADHKCGGGKH